MQKDKFKTFTIPVHIQGQKSQVFQIVAETEEEALKVAQRLVQKMVDKMNKELKNRRNLPN